MTEACLSKCPFFSDVVASTVSLQTLKEKLGCFTSEGQDGIPGGAEEEGGGESSLAALSSSLDDIIVLCHQSSQNLNQQQREVISGPACTVAVSSTLPSVLIRSVDVNVNSPETERKDLHSQDGSKLLTAGEHQHQKHEFLQALNSKEGKSPQT